MSQPCRDLKILIIDTETTSLEDNADVIEVAAGLYNTKMKELTQCISTLLPLSLEEVTALSEPTRADILGVTGIDVNWCLEVDRWSVFVTALKAMSSVADYAMAHNAPFDRKFFDDERLPSLKLRWINSQYINFPRKRRQLQSLTDLAISHKIPVIKAHRALNDIFLLSDLLSLVDNETILEAAQPRHLVVANLHYNQRQLAKDAGFVWDQIEKKQWAKFMTDHEIAQLDFRHTILKRDVDNY